MASVAQIQANRLNARKSTGPRTAEGKERASQNALKHGLLAREAVIAGEDAEEFGLYREQMLEELAPAGQVEATLAERVVGRSRPRHERTRARYPRHEAAQERSCARTTGGS